MIAKDKCGFNVDTVDILNFSIWIAVLAAPHLYRTITREVDPAHLVPYLDTWVAYSERGDHYQTKALTPAACERRVILARKLRDLVAAWTPPELPAEITETARALLDVEGIEPPGKGGWDNLDFDLEGDPVEDILIWPEGVPRLLRRDKAKPPRPGSS
jgi:hypothetical protein